MSGGRRHVGRPIKQREVRRYDREQSAAPTARQDIITRHAILYPHSGRAWGCKQSNGRNKASYRTREIAERVAELLRLLDGSMPMRVYPCRMGPSIRQMGEHFHLASVKLTPTDGGGSVSGVNENGSPEE